MSPFRRQGRATPRPVLAVLAVLAAAVTTLTAASGPAVAAQPGPPTDAELQAMLDRVVAAGASSAALRVDDGRRTVRLAAGAARLDPRVPMRPDARGRVGSITKTFVATATLQLVGERRLGLDDPVGKWLPGVLPDGDDITLRQLLQHTSGLFNYTEDEAFLEQLVTNPTRVWTDAELLGIITSRPLNFPPGTGWSYSNSGYFVLGLVLEAVTGRSVESLVEHRIIRPLHLTDTSFPSRRTTIPGFHARGYAPPSFTGAGYVDYTEQSPTWSNAAGAVVSNIDDLRRFYRALLSGQLLRPAELAAMKTLVDDEGGGYGLGLYRLQTACGPAWGHDGGVPGYTSISVNEENGRRGMSAIVPTYPVDDAIAAELGPVLNAAVCRAYGKPVPAPDPASLRHTGTMIFPLLDQLNLPRGPR